MRIILVLALCAVLFGCVGEGPSQPAAPNQSNQTVHASSNGTNATGPVPPVSPPETNTSANLTAPNATGNATSPELNGSAANETGTAGVANATRNVSGIVFGGGQYVLVLDDISVAGTQPCALLSVYYASNASQITKLDVCQGESQNWISPEGRIFRIVVLKTAPGYSENALWAQVEIFG